MGDTTSLAMDLYAFLLENVFLTVMIADDPKMARAIVLNQGKGLDAAPVVMFKSMVVFQYVVDEDEQDRCLEAWNQLMEEVGRGIVEKACVLQAQASLDRRPKESATDQVNLVEVWVRKAMSDSEEWDGKAFSDLEVQPASRALKAFEDGDYSFFMLEGNCASFNFFKSISKVKAIKQVQIVCLEILLFMREVEDPRSTPMLG